MIVTLMPLFIAASIGVNESDWKYGPEVIYDVRLDGMAPALDGSGRTVTFNTTMKLACRTKSDVIFSCNFGKPTTRVTSWKPEGDSRVVESSTEYLVKYPETTVFEYDFGPDVQRRLIVESSIEAARLNFVRAVIDQFNAVGNWTSDDSTDFHAMSDSTAGKCKTKYVKSTTRAADDDARSERTEELSTIILPSGKPIEGDVLEIQRIVDLGRCVYMVTRSGQMGVRRILASMESHIIVTKDNFTSYTDNVVFFEEDKENPLDDSVRSIGRERITVTLDKVVPAAGPLPTIGDPMSFEIRATRVFNSDSTDISFHQPLYNKWLSLIGDVLTGEKPETLEPENDPSQHMIE